MCVVCLGLHDEACCVCEAAQWSVLSVCGMCFFYCMYVCRVVCVCVCGYRMLCFVCGIPISLSRILQGFVVTVESV